MLNVFVIVWRESLEALLVIGVLAAWSAGQPDAARLRRLLAAGAASGLALATMLALLAFGAGQAFGGALLEGVQLAVVFGAAALMVGMLRWMRRHGRALRVRLEREAVESGALGVFGVAALAVAREGAETVLFLYGLMIETRGAALWPLLLAAGAGLALAAGTVWLASRASRVLPLPTVFRISEALLLCMATALIGNGVDRLIGLDWLPTLVDEVWDSGRWLDDGAGLGRVFADFAGYRARPSAVLLGAYALFWSLAWAVLRRPRAVPAAPGRAGP